MARAAPEVVFHLAAQSLVRRSYRDPVETYQTNVMGTLHLLEAVRRVASVRAVVVVTTDKCYQNREWVWGYRECDPMGGDDPYSSSKGCAELAAASYRRSFFAAPDAARIATARAGNVIGGGDWADDRLIPDILAAVAREEPVRIRNPGAIRPWQHVLEPLHGYVLLAEALLNRTPGADDGWNFGPPDEEAQPVSWIADHITHAWGNGAHWVRDGDVHPHEATYLKLDASKARLRLGWRPRLDLVTALEWTVAWFRGYREGADPLELTHRDLERYLARPSVHECSA
jgi:CDP-glucose 4,6-dehydratase